MHLNNPNCFLILRGKGTNSSPTEGTHSIAKQLPTPNLAIKGQRVKEGGTVADPREGSRGPGPLPLIFRPNWGPKGRQIVTPPPPTPLYHKVWIRHRGRAGSHHCLIFILAGQGYGFLGWLKKKINRK